MVIKPCEVTFHILIPQSLEQIPYILLLSYGKHIHPPPPPNVTPKAIADGLIQLLERMQDPTLTLGMFRMRSERLSNLFRTYSNCVFSSIPSK
jgi:hypothetical protein